MNASRALDPTEAHAVPDLSELIAGQARRWGDKTFIDSVDQGTRVSYRDLDRWCNRIANYLRAEGIGRGDPVSVIGRNSLETLLIFYGVIKSGAIVNPVNVEESPKNIRGILRYVRPRLVLHDADVPLAEYGIEGMERIPYVLAGEGGVDEAKGEFFSRVRGLSDAFVNRDSTPDDVCEYVFTSGTTSFPKGAVVTRRALYLMGAEVADRMGLTADDTMLEYRNYNWASAQTLSLIPSLVAGATLVFGRHFSRSRFAGWIRDKGVTIAAGVPTVINILVHDPVDLRPEVAPTLRFLTSSSAPLPMESQQAFERRYGIPIVQMAGMTEAGFMLGSPPDARKLGSAGLPCRYKRVAFLDEAGRPLPPGQQGEMVISGDSLALGYLQEDGSVARFPAEGFRTGDLGYLDADGYVFITGRVKDLIIKGGVNIAPAEITNRILAHPAVQEAVTVGVPDPIYGENVGSFVVVKAGSSLGAAEIVAHCAETLPSFKVPVRVEFVDAIPKNERGKVAKEALLALLPDGPAARPARPEPAGVEAPR